MHQDWIYTNVGQRVLSYALDPRPVWFWNEDGSELIWRNLAAKLFRSKFKKKGLKFLPDPVPLKGQVTRLIRLGHDGRASISRMRFQMGKKPVSATCSCVPLNNQDGTIGLFVISTDAIDFGLFDGDAFALVANEQLFTPAQYYVILNAENEIVAGGTASGDQDALQALVTTSFADLTKASSLEVSLKAGATLLMLDLHALAPAPQVLEETELDTGNVPNSDNTTSQEEDAVEDDAYDLPHLETLDIVAKETTDQSDSDQTIEADDTPLQVNENSNPAPSALTELIDHLYNSNDNITTSELEDADLLAENRIDPVEDFSDQDDFEVDKTVNTDLNDIDIEQTDEPLGAVREEMIALDDGEADQDANLGLWSISASHVMREADQGVLDGEKITQDKTTKYNFDELSRILHERVNTEDSRKSKDATSVASDTKPTPANIEPGKVVSMNSKQQLKTTGTSSLVALSDEALVLNKLPLGILIFRDQELLFANRSMADLAGYNTTNDLRDAGLDAILPRADDAGDNFGPVAKIQRQDGETVDVVARLQTTVWQGQNCYMLTAREEQTSRNNNGIIAQERDGAGIEFAKIAAALGNGYIQFNRAGYVLDMDAEGSRLFGPSIDLLRNRPILEYVSADTRGAYLNVLAGETDIGTIRAFAGAEHCEIKLFLSDAEDPSSSVFGLLSAEKADQAQIDHQKDELNSVLPILSREIRRPLASIAGFNSLMKDEAYGPVENDRYKEYIGDIQTATRQIEQVIGEIDDLSRLNIGEMEISNNKIDLGLLLSRCIVRIRGQANAQQVFVRSAIPETSYFVEADEKLLTQTIMNLLASAVTLTPAGGNVVLSAVRDDKDDLMIHVRDMGEHGQDRHEQFIVYHEPEGNDHMPADFVRSGVGLSLTHALAKANSFSLSLDQVGRTGMLMELAIPADRVTGTLN